MVTAPAVRARGITKGFGDVIALDGIDLDVDAGQIHGLVGPNGAGKTTLLGLLLGLALPDGGTLDILGNRIGRALAVPEGVAGFVDGPGLYPALTARQNLAAIASLRGYGDARSRVTDSLEEVGLGDVADDRLRGFSLGMRQRLGLAAALLTRPRLLVLDEPANGLDPAGTRHVHRVLTRLVETGTAVVLSSHRMDDLATLCSEVTILATGRVVFSGPLDKLTAQTGALDHRVVTTNGTAARQVAAGIESVRVVEDAQAAYRDQADAVVIRSDTDGVEAYVAGLVAAGIGVREVTPVIAPLEAAFLALTETPTDGPAETPTDTPNGNGGTR